MTSARLLARIAAEPGKMGGKLVIRGRRETPSMVINMLASGSTRSDALGAYPVLEPEDIDACLIYAARLSGRAAAEGLAIPAK
jgi:uncharacterized protein (DUF433 family)